MLRLPIAVVLFLLPLSAIAAKFPRTYEGAMQAYQAAEYPICAKTLVELSKMPSPRRSMIAYNAACCLALSARNEEAFESLEIAITTDMVAVRELEADPDLESLRKDAGWPAFIAHARQLEASQVARADNALRDELLSRMEKDLAARRRLAPKTPLGSALPEEVVQIDRDNTAWMKQLTADRGWPGKSLVLKDGSQAAWILVQHADEDRAFQKQVLELLKAAFAKNEATGENVAFLEDRVLAAEGKPQRYGTQYHTVNGKLVPKPIEDAARLDERRAALGLGTMAAYDRLMQESYGDKAYVAPTLIP